MTRTRHENEQSRKRMIAHRERLAKEGKVRLEVVLSQPDIEAIDRIQAAHNLPNRAAALRWLIVSYGEHSTE